MRRLQPQTRRSFIATTAAGAGLTVLGLNGCEQSPSSSPEDGTPSSSPEPTPGETGDRLRILVLGGTGFLGPHFVRSALAAGHEVTLFNRGKTNPEIFAELEQIRGDRDGKLDALAAEVEKGRRWNAVVDTSGYVPRIVGDSAQLLAAAADQYMFISSISVYGDPSKIGIVESDAVGVLEDKSVEEVTGETYGPLKALCEAAAESAFPGKTCNIRPGLIVGPGDKSDRYTYWPVRVAEGGPMIAPGNPSDPVQMIDARDLADWMLACIEQGHVGVFNATGPRDVLTVEQLIESCEKGTGGTPERVWIDAAFLEKHEVMPWMHMPVWVPPDSESGGMGAVSIAAALQRGLVFRPAENTARDTLAWWNQQEEDRRAKPRAGLAREKEAEVLAAWKNRGDSKSEDNGGEKSK